MRYRSRLGSILVGCLVFATGLGCQHARTAPGVSAGVYAGGTPDFSFILKVESNPSLLYVIASESPPYYREVSYSLRPSDDGFDISRDGRACDKMKLLEDHGDVLTMELDGQKLLLSRIGSLDMRKIFSVAKADAAQFKSMRLKGSSYLDTAAQMPRCM